MDVFTGLDITCSGREGKRVQVAEQPGGRWRDVDLYESVQMLQSFNMKHVHFYVENPQEVVEDRQVNKEPDVAKRFMDMAKERKFPTKIVNPPTSFMLKVKKKKNIPTDRPTHPLKSD